MHTRKYCSLIYFYIISNADISGRLYTGAPSDLSPNPIDRYLGLQLDLHFTKFGSTIGSQNIKPLYPSKDPILNVGNELEAIGPILRN
jgi:hypothetical protein